MPSADLDFPAVVVAGASSAFLTLQPQGAFRPSELRPSVETAEVFRVCAFKVGVVDQVEIPGGFAVSFRTFTELCRGRTFDVCRLGLTMSLIVVNTSNDPKLCQVKIFGDDVDAAPDHATPTR